MDFEINKEPQHLEKNNLVLERRESLERDDYQNGNQKLQNNNTTGQGASPGYTVALHTFIFALIGILGLCIELKFPEVSPYATDYGTHLMNIFTIEISFYILSLIVMTISAGRYGTDSEDLMNKVCVLCGTLPLILELLVLIKSFGWFTLIVWNMCFVWFVCKYYQFLKPLCKNAVQPFVQALEEFQQRLINWRSRRKMTRDDEAGDIEMQPWRESENISNDNNSTKHQSPDQNHTSVTEQANGIRLDTPEG